MILTVIIASATALSMTGVALIKPYVTIKNVRIGLYWIVCLCGAVILIASGCISFSSVLSGITSNTAVNPLKILALFISMTLVSLFLGDSGFFSLVAEKLFSKTQTGQKKLFFTLYFIVAVLTVFTSNDIIILTFTPPLLLFAKKAKISPFPYLFAEFVAANTWSMTLIVGNPTNVYLATTANIGFFEYLTKMWLPAIVGGLTGLLVLFLIFKKDLSKKPDFNNRSDYNENLLPVKPIDKFNMATSLIVLAITVVFLAISDFIHVEMWLVCVIAFGSLFIVTLIKEVVVRKSVLRTIWVLKEAPYELIPFVLSMFVIVLALTENGVTDILSNALVKGNKYDGLVFAIISALSSNFLNNIPMSVLFSGIAKNSSYAVLGTIIGSNIGAFITPVGALAGIMWNKILSDYGVRLPFYKFVLYGGTVAVFSLLTSASALLIV